MPTRILRFYVGVWLSPAGCWVIVVLAAAWHYKAGLGTGLSAATGGTMLAIIFAAFNERTDKKRSLKFVSLHPELSERDLLRAGLRKGIMLGVVSVFGVAFLLTAPVAADHILTALGK